MSVQGSSASLKPARLKRSGTSRSRSGLRRLLGVQGAALLVLFGSILVTMLITLLFTGRFVDEVFALGLNPEVEALSRAPLKLYPELMTARRESHRLRTELLAKNQVLLALPFNAAAVRVELAALCAKAPFLRRVELLPVDAPELVVRCNPGATETERSRTFERRLATGASLETTFGMAEATFSSFQRAGQAAERYQAMAGARDRLRSAYQQAFAIVLAAWVLIGGLLAVFLTRRTTRRLRTLLAATTSLSEGNFEVQVEITGNDELADLAEAFNTMVREISARREQVLYLERVSSWQEIARRLAHEIKNPLTPIQLAMQQLSSAYQGEDPRYARLLTQVREIVEEEVETLRRLVTAFSQFAKLPRVQPLPCELRSMLEEFLHTHPELETQARVQLILPESQEPIVAPVDRTLLGRVLTNLIENAVQAAELASLEPRVRLGLRKDENEDDEQVVIWVEDEGPGIAEENRSRIFDPYFTTKTTGTGLGLAISRKVLLQHGGELLLTIGPQGHPCFELRLPLASKSGPDDSPGPQPRTAPLRLSSPPV